ncbi:MAG TPA: hypothetical protein VNZ61_00685, partial [Roseomonas sp.]|nr:hypothetical protein [Roseomonas sp.]
YDARRVAEAIVGLARHPRDSVVVGSVVHLVRLGHALAPSWMARAMARFMEAYFRRAPAAPVTDGNLFAPPAVAGGIDGGLRAPRQRAAGRFLAGAALVVGVAAAVALLDRRGSGGLRLG